MEGLEQDIARRFERHRRDAVLLHRPYPPHEARRTNSKFGGLPTLPDAYDWPRTPHGLPLHFLAQVDCADILFRTALPERGVLFFFGRDDEQDWDAAQPQHACRVIYALDAFANLPERCPPDDLLPIGGDWPRENVRPLLRAGESGPSVHGQWPIDPIRIDSWPDFSGLPGEESFFPPGLSDIEKVRFVSDNRKASAEYDARRRIVIDAYKRALVTRRAEMIDAATCLPPPDDPDAWLVHTEAMGQALFGSPTDPDHFPPRWIHLSLCSRAVRACVSQIWPKSPDWDAVETAASTWLRRADAIASDAVVPAAERGAFRSWFADLPLRGRELVCVVDSAIGAIRDFAGDPELARLLPPAHYELLGPFFRGHSPWGRQFSQMLGHAPSAQDALPADDPAICLLNLASDLGLGWSFGDVGNCTFWISPRHLASRKFDKVWATIEGH